jgi:hypothetical protein
MNHDDREARGFARALRVADAAWRSLAPVLALAAAFTAATFAASVLFSPADGIWGIAGGGVFYAAAVMFAIAVASAVPDRPPAAAASAGSAVTAGADDRNAILHYAACLLPHDKRLQELVIAMAGPLLEWADAAEGEGDLCARMQAMSRAFDNDRVRLREAEAPARGFVACACIYYEFITGKAA